MVAAHADAGVDAGEAGVVSLASELEAGGMPIGRVLVLAGRIARTLDEVHAADGCHFDVRPATVWIAEDTGVVSLSVLEVPWSRRATLCRAMVRPIPHRN